MKKTPLKHRIHQALKEAPDRCLRYEDLMFKVFPPEEYPRAWRGKTAGGPPGCAMAFGRALREMGLIYTRQNRVRTIYYREGARL